MPRNPIDLNDPARGLPASAVPLNQPIREISPEMAAQMAAEASPSMVASASAVPPEVVAAAQQAQQAAQDRSQQKAKTHPILQALRRDLGVRRVETSNVEIGGHSWTIRSIDSEGQEWAAGLGFTSGSRNQYEGMIVMQKAMGIASVAAIDSVPLYEIVDIAIPSRLLPLQDPNWPPRIIRSQAMEKLWILMRDELLPDVAMQLYNAYTEKIDPKAGVTSSVGDMTAWICSNEDCRFEFVAVPVSKGDKKQPPFCTRCGHAMFENESSEGDALPLP